MWVGKLQQSGFKAQALPLIEIVQVSLPADIHAVEHVGRMLGNYTAVMFVSGNAVKHFFGLFSGMNRPLALINTAQAAPEIIALQLPDQLRFLAPGPGTVAALLAAGVPGSQIDSPLSDAAQFDSEALWQVVGKRDWAGCKVLIVRGKGDATDTTAGTGRNWLAQQWQAGKATVDVVSSYERRAPCLSAQQIELAKAACCDGSVWLFSSSEALANLMGEPRLRDIGWQGARAIATHPRIQAAAQAALWGVVRASRPGLADIVQALASIESTPT